jgi:hypothetical protein
LHQLQFAHVLRIKGRSEALKYAKVSFTAFAAQHMSEMQRLMACLLWANRLESSPYKDLLSPSHWDVVALQFSRECCNLLGQAYESPLYVTLSAGSQALSSLLKLATVMSSKKQVRPTCTLDVKLASLKSCSSFPGYISMVTDVGC